MLFRGEGFSVLGFCADVCISFSGGVYFVIEEGIGSCIYEVYFCDGGVICGKDDFIVCCVSALNAHPSGHDLAGVHCDIFLKKRTVYPLSVFFRIIFRGISAAC